MENYVPFLCSSVYILRLGRGPLSSHSFAETCEKLLAYQVAIFGHFICLVHRLSQGSLGSSEKQHARAGDKQVAREGDDGNERRTPLVPAFLDN